jgi:hypothetical protein
LLWGGYSTYDLSDYKVVYRNSIEIDIVSIENLTGTTPSYIRFHVKVTNTNKFALRVRFTFADSSTHVIPAEVVEYDLYVFSSGYIDPATDFNALLANNVYNFMRLAKWESTGSEIPFSPSSLVGSDFFGSGSVPGLAAALNRYSWTYTGFPIAIGVLNTGTSTLNDVGVSQIFYNHRITYLNGTISNGTYYLTTSDFLNYLAFNEVDVDISSAGSLIRNGSGVIFIHTCNNWSDIAEFNTLVDAFCQDHFNNLPSVAPHTRTYLGPGHSNYAIRFRPKWMYSSDTAPITTVVSSLQ